ncbi:CobD/CbiB family cobalamin biosynthesis protein, partial [Methylobacterium sp. WL18]|uniref:CobD/CbiB family cobalamin biosynthesis protein n=1 Tax=Methylobacterium sp. WL18 TaxID=2603897 RepID=UPI00164EE811
MLHPPDTLAILALALGIEAASGYPDALYKAIGHPVTWIGRLISWLERGLNRGSERRRRIAGCGALVLLLAATGLPAWALTGLSLWAGPLPALLLLGLLCASLPAQRSLNDHVAAVETALRDGGLVAGRRAVSMIVGRDPDQLDTPAVCRAAIESLAENFSDGIVAPAFWIGCLGLPGGALYKAINTADSMIGHRSPRYAAFGWAAARLDDLVNLPASRLAGLLIVGAAAL